MALNAHKTGLGESQAGLLFLMYLAHERNERPQAVAELASSEDANDKAWDDPIEYRMLMNRARSVTRRALKAMQAKGLVEPAGTKTVHSNQKVDVLNDRVTVWLGQYVPKGYTRESATWQLTEKGLIVAKSEYDATIASWANNENLAKATAALKGVLGSVHERARSDDEAH